MELKVLTLNIWGIPYVSKHREERLTAIINELKIGGYDIVSLQEVWSIKDCSKLIDETNNFLPFSHYFYSGVFGSGLLVLSKYPIVSTLYHAYSVNGYVHRIQHADWFGGKGVGLCKILVGNRIVHFYNAHLHAQYNKKCDDYKTHRVIQAFEISQFIEMTRGNALVQILAGDLNAEPTDVAYKIIIYNSKMVDTCTKTNFGTNECARNTFTPSKYKEKKPQGIRIDHILIRTADHISARVVNYCLPFPENVPKKKFSYSDHEAVLAVLELKEEETDGFGIVHSLFNIKPKVIDLNDPDLEGLDMRRDSSQSVKANISTLELYYRDARRHSKRVLLLQEGIELCSISLKQLKFDRFIYYSVAMLLITAFVCLEIFQPNSYSVPFLLLKFLMFGILIFCICMGSLWNYIERNGITSCKKAMENVLQNAQNFGV